jgi:5-methylcytosine-specific restriction protein A
MPDLPGRHRPPVKKQGWHRKREVGRIRNSAVYNRNRNAVLARDRYLCQPCLKRGRYTEAQEVDHVIPLASGGLDVVSNQQAICKPCHRIKSAVDGEGASTHPEWLPRPACKVVLVTGPPGAGKSTYCRERAKPGDTIIDLDECYREVAGKSGHDMTMDERRQWIAPALRYRNKLIADLAGKCAGTAYLIVAAPLRSRVEWWMKKLGAEHVLLDPGLDVCVARVKGQPVRESGVEAWYRRRTYTTSLPRALNTDVADAVTRQR